jgi:hypothetical protein
VAERRVVSGVTALSEMGWRVTLPSRATQRRLERDGWVAVGTWFPFRYFKRAVDAPVEADTEPEAR